MKRGHLVVTIALACFLILGIADIGFGQKFFLKNGVKTDKGAKWVPGEIIVKFKPGVSDEVIAKINSKHGSSEISNGRFHRFKRIRLPGKKTIAAMVATYKKNPNVEYAEPNYIAKAFEVPNDPYYTFQWHMGQINMEQAWDITHGDPNVVVAVLDTGVAYEDYEEFIDNPGPGRNYWITYKQAPDLASTLFVEGYDFVNNDSHPNDDQGHGTHVTGTIAQSTNNYEGVTGVAFGTAIMPIKVLDSSGSGTYADIVDGIYFAANNGANIINLSLGGSNKSIAMEDALAYAYNRGVTIVCSSGNDGSDVSVSYPAAYDAYCIAIGATGCDEGVAYYSNGGPSLDLVAPGGDTSIDHDGDGFVDGVLQQTFGDDPTDFGYWFYQGTSMAAPHVSGIAALLIARGVAITPDEVREALQSTAKDKGDIGWDPWYGWGIVDACAALNYTSAPNNSPVADAGGTYTGTEDMPVTFDGSGSYDPDGDPLTYMWDFGDGSTGAGERSTHTYTDGGTYTATLVVNDGRMNSTPDTTTINIIEVNDSPVADAGTDKTALPSSAVTFDGSNSYDPDGSIITYEWDFGDGEGATGAMQTHQFSGLGEYTVTLTVTDDGSPGQTGTDTAIVSISEESNLSMHVNDIKMELKPRTGRKNTFTIALATVSVVDADGNPVEGAAVYGHWSGATSDTDSGITQAEGNVILASDRVKKARRGTTFTFTIDNITKAGLEYDSSADISGSGTITVP